jgi:hypothetical protein
MGDLIYPPYGYAAVVEGAVRHLQKPSTIFKRVSNLTYGVRVFLNWSREMPESYKQWDTYYKAYVTDKAFLVAVRKGESVEVSGAARLGSRTALLPGPSGCLAPVLPVLGLHADAAGRLGQAEA